MDKVNIPYQPQGHRVKVKVTKVISVFWRFFANFSISSYSFHRRVLKTHRNVLWDHTQRSHAAEFWIFALKVKYWRSKVKLWNTLLTALMTFDLTHIKVIGRYGQGQHPISTSRSSGQSQGHKGHFRFLTIFANTTILTVLMTLNLDHIHKIGRYGQGQYPIWIPRSQGQGHEGHYLFLYVRS